MNFRAVLRFVSPVLLAVGLGQLLCALLAPALGGAADARAALFQSAAAALACGGCLRLATAGAAAGGLRGRDGFGVVVLGWVSAALAGALPWWLAGAAPSFNAAFFEAMSGFTTTGVSALAGAGGLPRALLLWRAMTQFLGGMGVLVLVVAVLPFGGAGGMSLFRAEMTGPVKDRLTPRIATTAKLLWFAYCGLTLAAVLLLRAVGMPWFDSVCHAFATLSSGGFSFRDGGLNAFHSPAVEAVVAAFMLLAGVNFALLCRFLRGGFRAPWRDSEFRFYVSAWFVLCVLFTAGLWWATPAGPGASARAAVFTVTSFLSTTGFATADFNAWPDFLRLALFLLFFLGGCAGSTAGGVKMVRVLAALKFVRHEIRLWVQPRAVMPVKLNGRPVEPGVLGGMMGFAALYVAVFAVSTLVLSPFIPGLFNAANIAAAMLSNTGAVFDAAGPAGDFGALPAMVRLFLSFLMLLGRLELYTVLVLFAPSFWRK